MLPYFSGSRQTSVQFEASLPSWWSAYFSQINHRGSSVFGSLVQPSVGRLLRNSSTFRLRVQLHCVARKRCNVASKRTNSSSFFIRMWNLQVFHWILSFFPSFMGLCTRERSPSAQLINERLFSGLNESAWVRLTRFKEGRDLFNHSRQEGAEKNLKVHICALEPCFYSSTASN